MKKSKQNIIPTIKEFTDEDGKKWIQTSTNDFLSLKELSDMLESVDQDQDSENIVFARIEFHKVNQEYHDLAVSLQEKLIKQTELLKKVIDESKKIIDKKNNKLKELITYIRKLHNYFEYIKSNEKEPDFMVPSEIKAHDWNSDYLISNLKDFSEEQHETMKEQKEFEKSDEDIENNSEEKTNQEDTVNMESKKEEKIETTPDTNDVKLSDIETSDGEEFEMMMLEDVEIFMSDVDEPKKSSSNSSNQEEVELNEQVEYEEIDLDEEEELVLENNKK